MTQKNGITLKKLVLLASLMSIALMLYFIPTRPQEKNGEGVNFFVPAQAEEYGTYDTYSFGLIF